MIDIGYILISLVMIESFDLDHKVVHRLSNIGHLIFSIWNLYLFLTYKTRNVAKASCCSIYVYIVAWVVVVV